jgi:TetR/AcrR family transcriptional regulator, fatty acid biosynthesis regulator
VRATRPLTQLADEVIGESIMAKILTRDESKAITKRRLLEAAMRIMSESSGRQLTASRVAREAGVAQPTFYVHFTDLDDLLQAVGEIQIDELRREFQKARAHIEMQALARGDRTETLRDAFQVPLRTILSRPMQFRLYVQERLHSDSPLGRYCRQIHVELRRDLLADLRSLDRFTGRERSEDHLKMLADGLMALTETLGLGCIEGRYGDVDAAVDVIVDFATGALV